VYNSFMKQEIKKNLKEAIMAWKREKSLPDFQLPEIVIDQPKDEKFGDYATNIAMVLASVLKIKPIEIASDLSAVLGQQFADNLEKIEAAEPGYVNFYLSQKYLQEKVAEINKQKGKFGNSNIGNAFSVNDEFISANPTGPLHLGNGRGGFYGDVISNVLKKSGFRVRKEYYVNDAGEQVIKLGHSVLKDSEAVYIGDYIDALNKKIGNIKDVKEAGKKAADVIIEEIIRKTVEDKMKIPEMNYVYEKDLYFPDETKSKVGEAIKILKDKELTYEKDGAIWFKSSGFGDDKDRVLIKSSGDKTYLASDCGYLLYKIQNNFNKIIEIWGADHHGYIKRFDAVARALGFSGELKFIIVQLVGLIKNGKEFKMSKRSGNVVCIDELIDTVGHDVTRFFFLMYAPDTHMNFDLGLAEERSEKNPVFYVQYAHARICGIIRKAEEADLKINNSKDLQLLTHEKELSLIRELNKFPELVSEISQSYEAHKLPHYAIKLADKFHSFYDACRVIDEGNPELSKARLNLVNAVRIVLAETLRLIGVEAPERM
jgi:arginyl-tRNA synthetase